MDTGSIYSHTDAAPVGAKKQRSWKAKLSVYQSVCIPSLTGWLGGDLEIDVQERHRVELLLTERSQHGGNVVLLYEMKQRRPFNHLVTYVVTFDVM